LIDFTATYSEDSQAARCARLLTAVIASALHDAVKRPSKKEASQFRNIDTAARAGLWFLWSERSLFPLYAELIGSSAEAIRGALLSDVTLAGARRPHTARQCNTFTEEKRRNLQWRYRVWSSADDKDAEPVEEEETVDA